MSHMFTRALERKAAQEPHAELLLSQWNFDRRALTQSLASIVYTFPHYSRHDHSHADEILVKITRILGEARISQLSATDLWLLLEAAYNHDIGMVVDDVTAKTWVETEDYRRFLDKLRDGSDDVAEAARRLESRSYPANDVWSLDVRRDLVTVLAEYARREHARRTEHVVMNPAGIGMQSPRTGHIPSRLWGVLARICRCHGENFETVMQLPYREAGLGSDHAHPRFVACMLRIGDLLDLDNGRFCETMLSAFGVPLNATRAHMGKHAAIEHLDVDSTTIEVIANCVSYEEYEVTESWFDMLRSELSQQSSKWTHIAPGPDFGTLPSLGRVQASLRSTNLLLLSPNQRPRFTVDRDAVMDLVRGDKLYTDPVVWVRELLQNAIDATYLRIYLEDPAAAANPVPSPLEWLRERVRDYPISVKIHREAREGEHTVWKVRIRDQGLGISREDLQYIQTIGSSALNPTRRRLRHEMPEWMWPSGIFGIGLQSVFMATDAVTITSHHAQSSDAFRIRIEKCKAARSSSGDLICIEEIPHVRRLTGCEIEFDWRTASVAERVSMNSRILRSFDGCADQEMPDLIERACKKVDDARENSISCISLETSLELTSDDVVTPQLPMERHWSYKYGVEVCIRRIAGALKDSFHRDYFYRGMEIERAGHKLSFLPLMDRMWMDFDLFWGSAKDLLNAERSDFGRDVDGEVARHAMLAALEAMIKIWGHAPPENRPMLSLISTCLYNAYVKGYLPAFLNESNDPAPSQLLRALSNLAGDGFKSCELGSEITVSQCLAAGSVLITNHFVNDGEREAGQNYFRLLPSSESAAGKWLEAYSDADKVLVLLSKSIAIVDDPERGRVLRLWFDTDEGSAEIHANNLMVWTLQSLDPARLRTFHPCLARFGALAITKQPTWATPSGFLELTILSHTQIKTRDTMVCPFTARSKARAPRYQPERPQILIPNITNLLEWTWQHRRQPSTTRKQIVDAMREFLNYADELMKGAWDAKYDLSEVGRELDRFADRNP